MSSDDDEEEEEEAPTAPACFDNSDAAVADRAVGGEEEEAASAEPIKVPVCSDTSLIPTPAAPEATTTPERAAEDPESNKAGGGIVDGRGGREPRDIFSRNSFARTILGASLLLRVF